LRIFENVKNCAEVWRTAAGTAEQGELGAEPPTFKSGGLISKIAPYFLCHKNILQEPFGAIRQITV